MQYIEHIVDRMLNKINGINILNIKLICKSCWENDRNFSEVRNQGGAYRKTYRCKVCTGIDEWGCRPPVDAINFKDTLRKAILMGIRSKSIGLCKPCLEVGKKVRMLYKVSREGAFGPCIGFYCSSRYCHSSSLASSEHKAAILSGNELEKTIQEQENTLKILYSQSYLEKCRK